MTENELVQVLSQTQLFAHFPENILEDLASHAVTEDHELGDVIASRDDPVEGVIVVLHGRVRMFAEEDGREVSISLLERGGTAGEVLLLEPDARHKYGLRSSGKSTIAIIPPRAIHDVLKPHREQYETACRNAIVQSAAELIREVLKLGKAIAADEFDDIITRIGTKRFPAGHTVLEQGDTREKRLYVVTSGQVRLAVEKNGLSINMGLVGRGGLFGVNACVEGITQPASVVTTCDTSVFVVPIELVRDLARKSPSLRDSLADENESFRLRLEHMEKLGAPRKPRAIDRFFTFKIPKKAKLLRRFELVRQAEDGDSAAAAIATLCRYRGVTVTASQVRELFGDGDGSPPLGVLAAASERLGFLAEEQTLSWQQIQSLEMPVLVQWKTDRYAVIHGISRTHVWVADPEDGFLKIEREDFEREWEGLALTLVPSIAATPRKESRAMWNLLIPYVWPELPLLRQMFVATLLISLMGLVPPIIVQNVLDTVVVHQSVSFLNVLAMGMVVISIFSVLGGWFRRFLSFFMARRIDYRMLSDLYKHILGLPLSFFESRQTGDIMARFSEMTSVRGFMTETMIATVLNAVMVVVYITLMGIYNIWLTLLVLAFLPLILGLTLVTAPRYRKYALESFVARTEQDSMLVETLSGVDTVKGMGKEHVLRQKWQALFARLLNLQYRAGRFDATVSAVSGLLKAGSNVGMLWVGAMLVIRGKLSIGQLMAFQILLASVMDPLMDLVGVWDEFQEAKVSCEKASEVLMEKQEQAPEEQANKIVLPPIDGHIEVRGCYFRYRGADERYVLQNVNMDIRPGDTVAIVGRSGSGKSTLIKLLLGFYRPGEGTLLVDGFDINTLDVFSYRRQVGYVMQNNLLFSGTISSNIALGEDEPDAVAVREAAMLADAHGFIQDMPMQYDQPVGERGTTLSGGQRQRICIARALYHNPRMLVMDEATSSLDAESEAQIQSNLREILRGRTAIVVAHRLSTVREADCVFVLHEGVVAESGKHDELMARKGVYYHLVSRQTGDDLA